MEHTKLSLARRLKLQQLAIFEKVVESGSILAASRELHMTQPAVSKSIHELEGHFGEALFTRGKLGYGGMVSLGHAMYIGLGAYGVALLSAHGVHAGWLHLLVIFAVTAVVAALVGWVSLRTEGIAFIMITLAFAQLVYFVFVSLRAYGGDDGLTLARMSDFGAFSNNRYALYLSAAAALGGVLLLCSRMMRSRFGLVLRASRVNQRRVDALGTRSIAYKLLAYVLSALICALAGFFLVNLTAFASPAYMAWTVSGELIVMVLLGGVGTIAGPVVGAFTLLLLEEGLKAYTEHWPIVLGPLIVAMVVFLRGGLCGLLDRPGAAAAPKAGSHHTAPAPEVPR